MKELTIEQKAKAYDEALKWMCDLYPNLGIAAKEKAESIFPELRGSENERIRGAIIDHLKDNNLTEWATWLEKQGQEPRKVSIWKHWKDGICGNGEGKLIYLIKNGDDYSLSSSLGFECDYIELSELDNLMLEKQGEHKLPIEKLPEEMKSIEESLGFTTQEECDEYNQMVSDLIMSDGNKGEQKPVDNVGSKFKVEEGKWYVCTQTFVLRGKIVIIKGQTYQAEKDNVIKGENGCRFIDRHDGKASDYFRPWTIQDAKDGDVLAEDTCTFIIKKLNHDLTAKIYCCLYSDGDFEINSNLGFDDTCTYPATKEQRDLLFQKMKEAGYEWDAEKKELKEIGQKPIDIVEPKFKVGDWITDGQLTCKVLEITGKSYELHLHNDDYCHFETDVQSVDKHYHLWTIEDAKNGDVLHSTGWYNDNDCIFIFNELDNWKFYEPNGDRAVATGHCCLFVSADKMEFGIQGPDCVEVNTVKPATKIQRNLLFQKMKEAGYEWDTEKKELKLLITNGGDFSFESENCEQNHAWGEAVEDIKEALCTEYEKGRADAFVQMQKEWSGDDDWMKTKIIKVLLGSETFLTSEETNECIDWLKSLRQRYTWKPSDEQMEALFVLLPTVSYGRNPAFSLYNDLKKLKE